MREKLVAIQQAGIDRAVILEFNQRLAAMEADAFIQELLVEGLGVQYLFVGDDFRFGRGRTGSIELLREAGQLHGFGVENMHTFLVGEERVSSTRIREALAMGDLESAAHNLGRPYTIQGRVGHGDKRGRTIGFPTLNVNLHRRVSPLRGVFAVSVHGVEDRPMPGVANIGTRPTITGDPRYLLEVHLFDFERSIYGCHVQVEFCKRLRDERRFDSFDELRCQIERDSAAAREFFGLGASRSD
jgi:riboflavin kinase/FMN adenylyltransferase